MEVWPVSYVALPGGGADKVGNWFEEAWAILVMLEMLAGLGTQMCNEQPGTVEFEFWVDREKSREWHQVKWSARNGNWSLYELSEENILEHIKLKLRDDTKNRCVIASAHSVEPLAKLCARAAKSADYDALNDNFLSSSEKLREGFTGLCDKYWKSASDEVFQWLQGRVRAETIKETMLQKHLELAARAFITGDPKDTLPVLLQTLRGSIYEVITRDDLDQTLAAAGFPPRDLTTTGTVADELRRSSTDFVSSTETHLVGNTVILRDQVARTRELLSQRRPPQTILLSGPKGVGKSVIVSEVLSWTANQGLTTLTVDLRQLSVELTLQDLSDTLALPKETGPASTLANIARGGKALLVIDALDEIARDRDRPLELFVVIDKLIQEAALFANVTVLVSCRSSDLANDERLRPLVDDAEQIEVPLLNRPTVRGLLEGAGIDLDALDEDQFRLLELPLHLHYLVKTKDAGPFDFRSADDLEQHYLDWITSQ